MTHGPRSATGTQADRQLIESIDDLHRVCGVYTTPAVAGRILDAVGWHADSELSNHRLLEPGAGEGEFVVQAGTRLIASCRAHGITLTARTLCPRITAFELHPGAASTAQHRVTLALQRAGLHPAIASRCATAWIRNADFLLSETTPSHYTHVVGNPPYIRWSKIPTHLKSIYESRLPQRVIHGDLFLPFLDRAFELLRPSGKCGILCSDRWMYMAFAERFRHRWLPWLDILSNDSVNASDVFARRVDTYPTILIASKRLAPKPPTPATVPRSGNTLGDLDCVIKAGPALGHTPAFVIRPDDDDDEDNVEPELLRPWIHSSEILDGSIAWQGRYVVTMFADDGKLLDLRNFPRLERRLTRFLPELTNRYIVRNGAPWFRTIDRIRAAEWQHSKLLVPELARSPRIALDRSGAVPSHGVYAIFAPADRIDHIYDALRDGGLARALDGIAPKLKGNYTRCYKRFLSRIRIKT